jgi:hypothetical protein
MRTYNGYRYKVTNHKAVFDYKTYDLYNERGEIECELLSLRELKEVVDTRIRLGYWAY